VQSVVVTVFVFWNAEFEYQKGHLAVMSCRIFGEQKALRTNISFRLFVFGATAPSGPGSPHSRRF